MIDGYSPWPDDGCPLLAARRRTAERGLGHRVASTTEQAAADFLGWLRRDRLVAFGKDSLEVPARRIEAVSWAALTHIDWRNSSASNQQGNQTLMDIRVFPPLRSPCRVQVLTGNTLVEAFEKFVMRDPEVAALGRLAVKAAPEYRQVFKHYRSTVAGVAEWPVSFEEGNVLGVVHPDLKRRSLVGYLSDPDVPSVVNAAEALSERYGALLSMLRKGEIEAHGIPQASRFPPVIPRSIWSHRGFYFSAHSGDVLELNRQNLDSIFDRFHVRWIGVELHEPSPSRRAAESSEGATAYVSREADPEPRSTSVYARVAKPTAPTNAKTTAAARERAERDCDIWFRGKIQEDPEKRLYSKEVLLKEVRDKWQRALLSDRAFYSIRKAAIKQTGASAWAAGGAPRKPVANNRSRKNRNTKKP